MNIKIRTITQKDNGPLAAIIRSCFVDFDAPTQGTVFEDPTTDDLYSLFTTPNAALFVAEVDGELAGCCGIYPTNNLPHQYCELVKFYVHKNFRGQQVGKALFEKSLQSAQAMGFSTVYIESLPAFSKAVRLYEQYGFTFLNSPLGNSGHTGCTIWMIKKL